MRAATIALLSLGVVTASVAGQASAQGVAAGDCFYGRDMGEWKSPDPHTMYVSATNDRYYRVQFRQPCQPLSYADAHLITKFHGPDSVCGPLDWDLQVADNHGNRQACLVTSMTRMSPEEVAAIPSKFRP